VPAELHKGCSGVAAAAAAVLLACTGFPGSHWRVEGSGPHLMQPLLKLLTVAQRQRMWLLSVVE
jgi:hypothetical protein